MFLSLDSKYASVPRQKNTSPTINLKIKIKLNFMKLSIIRCEAMKYIITLQAKWIQHIFIMQHMTQYKPSQLFTSTFLTHHFHMILNQHKTSNNIPMSWKNYFLVTVAYGSKWLPSLIQYGGQMTIDQNMLPTFFDPQVIYLQDLKSNQLQSNMDTQDLPAARPLKN